MKEAALTYSNDTLVLYAPGDNELNDCHRHASASASKQRPSDMVTAAKARQFLIDDLGLGKWRDVTGRFPVEQHTKMGTIPDGSTKVKRYSCDFDTYVELDDYAIATLEVIGSHWYLDVRMEEAKRMCRCCRHGNVSQQCKQ